MKETGISFTAEMLLAVLQKRKLQTRRVLRKQPKMADGSKTNWTRVERVGKWFHIMADEPQKAMFTVTCPYGTVGDLLYIKETWRTDKKFDRLSPSQIFKKMRGSVSTDYKSTEELLLQQYETRPLEGRWRSARFMPKWAAIHWLKITNVRLQRVDEISESDAKAEGAGIPMPLEGSRLCVHPKYRFAKIFDEQGRKELPERDPEEERFNVVNQWCRHGKLHLVVRSVKTRLARAWSFTTRTRFQLAMETLAVSDAWDVAAEHRALMKLATLLTHRKFSQYLLSGMFAEQSERSKLFYVFRRLRPTLAIRGTGNEDGTDRVLCGLCLHPIGFYEHTFAGSLVPTDDVIAHLLLMRGDEHEFWKQANQHPENIPESGL